MFKQLMCWTQGKKKEKKLFKKLKSLFRVKYGCLKTMPLMGQETEYEQLSGRHSTQNYVGSHKTSGSIISVPHLSMHTLTAVQKFSLQTKDPPLFSETHILFPSH